MGRPRSDLVGRVFGRLTVQKLDHVTSRHASMWRCLCECGKETVSTGSNLKKGGALSCGCLRREISRARTTIHGGTGTHSWNVWRGMLDRCNLATHKSFHNYGGRGISVCERWKKYEAFLSDMGHPPDQFHTLDRKNVDGGYEPENCMWATYHQQARNRRTNVFYEYMGRKLVIKDLSEACGVPEQTLYNRFRRGLSVDEATYHGRLPKK